MPIAGLADVHVTIPDLRDDSVVHSVGSAQPEFLGVLVEYVDRAGLGPRELGRLCDDGGQHGLQVDRRVDRLGDVAERAQLLDRLRQLGRPLLDLLLEPVGSLRPLGQQLVALQRVLAEDLDHPSHLGDLVAAGNIDRAVVGAGGNGKHAVAQPHQPAQEIAADVEPDDQDRTDQAQGRERQQDACAQPLNRERAFDRRVHFGLRLPHQLIDRRCETGGQIGVRGDQLLGVCDQIELLGAHGQDRIRPESECAHAVKLLDQQGAQLRVEILRLGREIIEAAAQLETDHRQARLLADSRGLHQLVESGGEAALRSLCRAVEHNPGREIACLLAHRLGAALACLVERAADLHLHNLEPWGEQLLRGLTGLKHRLQEAGEALSRLQPLSHQRLELRQVRSQRGDQQLDRDRRLARRCRHVRYRSGR